MSLSLFRFPTLSGRAWAFSQMLFARFALPRVPGIGFYKLFGTGTGEGFTPIPNTAVYAVLATWPSAAEARERIEQAAVFQRYRKQASESWTVFLAATGARGRWDRRMPFETGPRPDNDCVRAGGPVVALTRATIRPSVLLRFWKRVPAISSVIGADPHVVFKIGMGEVPWFHQVTFSIWPDEASMAAFARSSGPHAEAIRAVRKENWFSEELYARFRVLDDSGTWNGTRPLEAVQHPLTLAG
ncbi:MAG: spheroidene monooxygenase [Pseudomonadota bacterium]